MSMCDYLAATVTALESVNVIGVPAATMMSRSA
jgi:hypothetical protein